MNLIEQLGGYEKAKRELELKEQNSIFQCCAFVTDDMIRSAMLEYRRQHNIFEVGDRVVWINSIAPNDPRLFEIEQNLGKKPDTWSLRHATDAEIQAGKRL